MRFLVIANPVAGRRDRTRLLAALEADLVARGAHVEVRRTQAAGDATRLAAETPGDCDAVLAVGGDGTVSEVAEGLRGRAVPLGIVPVGTANALARELGLPWRLPRIGEVFAAGKVRRIDAGLLNGRRFLLMVGIGFDAEVALRHRRGAGGHNSYLAYVGPIAGTLRGFTLPSLRVDVDGQPLPGEWTHVGVGNTRTYGGPFAVTAQAVVDDGWLDVTALSGRGRVRWGRYLLAAACRRLHRARGAVAARARAVRVTSAAPAPVQRDGDAAGTTPCEITLEPAAVPVLVP